MKIKLSIYILVALGITACCKDKIDPNLSNNEDEECYTFDLPDFQTVPYSEERFQYKSPHFNPNSSSEFIYHFRDNEQNAFQLLKYNIQTQQKTLIVESGKIWGQPKWSSNGWIAYTHYVGYVDHIFTVKENGDGLTQFTENVSNMYPAWSSTGSELYWMHTPNLGVPYYFLKQNINTSSPDTLSKNGDAYNGYIRYSTISPNNKLLSLIFINNNPHLARASLDEEPLSFSSIANMNQVFNSPNPSGLCWSNDGEYAFLTIRAKGLYKINVNNSNKELLIPFCDSKRYETISASSNGKYLIGERVDSYLKTDEENNPTGPIMEGSSIYLINLQTLEETKIDLSP